MTDAEKQSAVLTLHQQGIPKKRIAALLRLDVKTVRKIIARGDISTSLQRASRISIDEELLCRVYKDCHGYAQRTSEVLREEYGIDIGYSTLTRRIRSSGLRGKKKADGQHVPDEPGAEMQHDTTVSTLTIGGRKRRVICSGLYMRYSKMRFIKYYPRFNRFTMKCFLYEALMHWGYTAAVCIIDNTNLAILRGSGSSAVFHPEMIAFGATFGFDWYAHALGHANRKAGKEKNFHTVETNFIPGRIFGSFEDLNRQAFEWTTQRYAHRPQSHTRLIPARLFENEKPFLHQLQPGIQPPYQHHRRMVDSCGYIAFHANYYFVPNALRQWVLVIQYPHEIKIIQNHRLLARYVLAPVDVTNQRFMPPGYKPGPHYKPRNRKNNSLEQERHLRQFGEEAGRYLDYIKSAVRYRHHFIHELFALSRQLSPSLFLKTITRALEYKADSFALVRTIAAEITREHAYSMPSVELHEDYRQRKAYQDGMFCRENQCDEEQTP